MLLNTIVDYTQQAQEANIAYGFGYAVEISNIHTLLLEVFLIFKRNLQTITF